MKNNKLSVIIITALMLCLTLTAAAQNIKQQDEIVPGEDVILQWNRVLGQVIATPGAHPATILSQRSFAMMHLGMFDAVNSIDGTYTPYLTDVPSAKAASPKAAAAKAARDILTALYPSQQALFDAEFADSIIGIPTNQAQQGINIGATVATRMLANRANDGWTVTPPAYVLPLTPGNWQPTPPANAAAIFTHIPNVIPFSLSQSSQFLVAPPFALTSAEYATDFNETKELGAVGSTTRTADQTATAQLWASGPLADTRYTNLVRSFALSRNLSTVENARLFALIYLSSHDSLQTSFTSQYTYGRWRPITAIRRADEDNNPNTTQDAAWSPLINSAPYPTYASNASAASSSLATMMSLYFGRDDIAFQVNFGGTPNVIRNYPSFTTLTNEVALSRIYAGIHFRADLNAGQSIGKNVANYVFMNYLKPRKCEL